jgi:hypothetical protein
VIEITIPKLFLDHRHRKPCRQPRAAYGLRYSINVRLGSWPRENAEIEFANGNFVSTSVNLKNKSAGDGCRDKTIEKTILRAFRARTFSRSQGQQQTSPDHRGMSGLCH